MEVNTLPHYDTSDNPTGCCPRFNPEGWDGQTLHFDDKPFVRVETRSLFHIPINMGKVFSRTFEILEKYDAVDEHHFLILTNDLTPWKEEHFFSVTKDVPGYEMVYFDGEFITKVFEGPYKYAPQWYAEMKLYADKLGKRANSIFFFYTTCPKCAKFYGKNYVVGFAKTA